MEIESCKSTQQESEGVWFPHDGAQFLICSIEKPEFEKSCQAKLRPYRRQIRRGLISPETVNDITLRAMSEEILIGWKGVTENGEEKPYSKEAAYEYLSKYPKFRRMIDDFASDQAAFVEQERTEGIDSAKKS